MNKSARMIEDELKKQYSRWGVRGHSDERWMLILAEEVGEVANAILENKSKDEIDKEIVQVGVAVRGWLEDRNDEKGEDNEKE